MVTVSSLEYKGTRAVLAQIPYELRARLHKISLDAYRALRVRDYGRVDLAADRHRRGLRHRGQRELLPRGEERVRHGRGRRRHGLHDAGQSPRRAGVERFGRGAHPIAGEPAPVFSS